MSITIVCQCGAKLKPPDSFTGTKIRCPKCSASILVSINDIAIVESSESTQIDLNSSGHFTNDSTINEDSYFKLLCLKCNTIISPITKLPGKIIECSKCKQLLQIPEQDLNNENSDIAESETNIPKKKKKKKKIANKTTEISTYSSDDKYWDTIAAYEMRRYGNRQPSVLIGFLLEFLVGFFSAGILSGCGLAYMGHGYSFLKSSFITLAVYVFFIVISCGIGLFLWPIYAGLCTIKLIVFCFLVFFM